MTRVCVCVCVCGGGGGGGGQLCQFKSGVKFTRKVGTDFKRYDFHLLSTIVFHLKIRNTDLVPLMPDWCYKFINVRRFRKI